MTVLLRFVDRGRRCGPVSVGAAIAEDDKLGERVRAFWAAEERRMPDLEVLRWMEGLVWNTGQKAKCRAGWTSHCCR